MNFTNYHYHAQGKSQIASWMLWKQQFPAHSLLHKNIQNPPCIGIIEEQVLSVVLVVVNPPKQG